MAMEIDRANARLKDGLGWATLGLAAGLLMAPSQVARLIGAPDDERSRGALRAVGLRELAAYVLIERTGPTAGFPLWVRAGGDVIDLTLLGLAARRKGADRRKLGVAAANIAAIAALDAYAAIRLGAAASTPDPGSAQPEEDLTDDPAYEPPEPFRGIKGG
jgi:hypothetical protein